MLHRTGLIPSAAAGPGRLTLPLLAAVLAAGLWLGAPSSAMAQLDCEGIIGAIPNGDDCTIPGTVVAEADDDVKIPGDLIIESGGVLRFTANKTLTVGGDLIIEASGTLSSAGENGANGANSSTEPGDGDPGTPGFNLNVIVGGNAEIDGRVSSAGGKGGNGGNGTGNASGSGVDAGDGGDGAAGGSLTFEINGDAFIGDAASVSTDGGAGGNGGNGQNTATTTGDGGDGGFGGSGGDAGGLSFTVCGMLNVEAGEETGGLLSASGGNGGKGGNGGTGRGSGNSGGDGGNGGDGGEGNDIELHADGDVTIAGSVIAVGGAAGDGGNRGNGASGASAGDSGEPGQAGTDGTITVSTAQDSVDVLDATFIPEELIETDADARCGNGVPEPTELVLFLHNNPTPPTGNTTSQPNSVNMLMSTTAPTATTLFNYDTDRDSFPGRLISKTGTPPLHTESDNDKYQTWRIAAPTAGVVLDGDVELTFWSAMKDFDTGKRGFVVAFLRNCSTATTNTNTTDPTAAGCFLIATGSLNPTANWQGGITNWVEKTITFSGVNHTVPSGRFLQLKITVSGNSGDDMWFAYDTVNHQSRLIIPPATP